MTTTPFRRTSEILAEKLPPMDAEVREKIIATAKFELMQLLLQRLSDTKARERDARRKQPGEHYILRGIRMAERRVERHMLAVMEKELKAQRGAKTWSGRERKRLAAEYKRLKAGLGLTGLTTGKRKPPPPDPFKGTKFAGKTPGGLP